MSPFDIIIEQKPAEIYFNVDDIKAAVADEMEQYKNASFTEESKGIAKSTVASLRAKKKEIDDRRKEIKRIYMKPYDAFDAQVKDILKLIDEPIALIDSQVKAFDEKRRQDRREMIHKIYQEVDPDIREYMPLESIYDHRWENAAASAKSIRTAISAAAQGTKDAVCMIQGSHSDATHKALEIYRETRDLAKAMAHISQYEIQKAEVLEKERQRQHETEEHRAAQEIQQAREDERQRTMQEMMQPEPVSPTPDAAFEQMSLNLPKEPDMEHMPFVQDDTKMVQYTVIATLEELEEIDIMLNTIGVYFTKQEKQEEPWKQ